MASTGTALFPGASTFPNTNVYPGQGINPLVRVYVTTTDPQLEQPGFTLTVPRLTPQWVDVTSRVRNWSVMRGRNSELEDFDAGSATVVLDNRDRAYDPNSNAAVVPMNRLWISLQFDGKTEDQFFGWAESWEQNWPEPGISDATVTLTASDEFKLLNLIETPISGTINDVTGALINILNLPPNRAPRVLGTSASGANIVESGTSQPLLQGIQDTVRSENQSGTSTGQNQCFFVAKNGAVTYLEANHRSRAPYDTVQTTFDDDGTDSPYLDITIDYSDSFLFNYWTVNGTSATSASASDATSLFKYGQRNASRSVLFDASTAAGGRVALDLSLKYSVPMYRITSLNPDMGDPDTASNVIGRDLMDRIRVFRTPPGGGSRIDQTLFIQRIEWTGMPGAPPSLLLGVSPL